MQKQRIATLLSVLALAVVAAIVGWLAGSTIQSPAEAAARTAPPTPAPILVPVEARVLTSDIVTRGTARYGLPKALALAPSALKIQSGVITTLPARGDQVEEGDLLLTASGRPVFVLAGETPVYRDLVPGIFGDDVRQFEEAIQRLGVDPGPLDGVYDEKTSQAVADWYTAKGWSPLAPSSAQQTTVQTIEQALAVARNQQAAAAAVIAAAPLMIEEVRARADLANKTAAAALAVQESANTSVRQPLPARQDNPIARSGMTFQDLLQEVIAGIFARPGRMALTVLGIVIGLTALVATLGLARTAGNRIITQFDELAATEILVTAKSGLGGVDPRVIPWDASERLQRLNGVVAAGTLSEVDIANALVSASAIKNPKQQSAFKLAVQAASPSLFTAVRAKVASGRLPDDGHAQRADRVAVLGPEAAQRLGIVEVAHLPSIAIGDQIYLVIGILEAVARQPDLLASVIIPEGTARHYFGLIGPGAVVLETRIGATALIARQTPLALRPDDPSLLKVEFAPEPQRVRDAVQGDLNRMFVLLGGLSLIVGAIGIGNITLVSVIERIGEIGLRRAMGATRGHIALQFLLESATMGLIGGIFGASLGVLIVVAVAAYQRWTPVLEPAVPFLAPLIGCAIGLVAGLYPALRAARLEPAEAVRNG